ncbi:MAG: hypothetical protein QY332_18005 [Anaerolineales bacterium]|nr:MAG: hypothetical protein QY332_18005 [Anaerolineales bacterium]
MAKQIVFMGLVFLVILSVSACSSNPTPEGWWWVEMAFQCGNGSSINASVPFEITQDGTLTGRGTIQGTVKLRPPLPCPELETVSIEGALNLVGFYTDSGEGGFIFDQVDFETSTKQIPATTCSEKDLSAIDISMIVMDVSMFITSLETSWDKKINFSVTGERSRNDAPDVVAQDGSEAIMQVGFCNLNIVLHQGEFQGASSP